MNKIPQVRKNIDKMSGYVPGEQPKGLSRIIKLNTNENPYPPSPEAKKALENFDWQRLNRYPDPVGQALREEIAAYHGVSPDMIICANGSDDILTIVSRCFIDPDHALACPDPTYSLYVSLAALQDAPCIRIPLLDGFEDRGISGGASDSHLLQIFDQRCLGVACGRLCKVARGYHFVAAPRLPLLHIGQTNITELIGIVLIRLFIGCLLVHNHVAGESNGISARTEQVSFGCEVYAQRSQLCGLHLACHKSFPDKRV